MTPEQAKKEIRSFEDKYGLIVQADGNGGDTAQRTGLFWSAVYLLEYGNRSLEFWTANHYDFISDYRYLEIDHGILRRHPDRAPDAGQPGVRDFAYWNNPSVFSRDQWVSLCIALGFYEMTAELQRLFTAHRKRWFFHQNYDLTGPQHFGIWIRSLNAKYMWPLLFVTDIFLVLSSFIDLAKYYTDPDDTSDVINGVLVLIQAAERMPTPLSWLARKLMGARNPQEAFGIYFNPATGAPPFDGLYRPLIEKYFG